MNQPTIHTLSFVFDNQSDHILLLQIADDGPLKKKHTGIKGSIGLAEGMNQAAIRSMETSSGLAVSNAVLRGVVKTIDAENNLSHIYMVYESSRFSGELTGPLAGRPKWVDILNVFNLALEPLVQIIMPHLLEGESFFEGTIHLNSQGGVGHSDFHPSSEF